MRAAALFLTDCWCAKENQTVGGVCSTAEADMLEHEDLVRLVLSCSIVQHVLHKWQ